MPSSVGWVEGAAENVSTKLAPPGDWMRRRDVGCTFPFHSTDGARCRHLTRSTRS